MNIQGTPQVGRSLDDCSEQELYALWQEVLAVVVDIDRLWVAMPQCPQMHGDPPGDPDYFGDPSSS